MAGNKTIATDASVAAYLAAIVPDQQRQDCRVLADLMARATGETAKMWGTSIVGFGTCHYRYDSGREGDICLVGFAARKNDITLYGLNTVPDHDALIAQLGTCKAGKGCLHIKRLADVDLTLLEKLVVATLAHQRPAA